jgi:NADPH:quinone reductase-like Zn-dependent oxidoreductase
MARAVRFDRYGGPEVLRIVEVETPPPGPGEVRLRVRALGLNRAEALLRAGAYIEEARFPSGLGLEAAGTVDSVGEGVAGLAPGDAVSLIPPRSMVEWPTYAELVTAPADRVVKHPPALSFEEAASVWMAHLTAYGALVDIAALGPGEPVAITAASSSVGLAAIAIANQRGAVPIAVTRSSAKAAALRQAGAAHVVASAEEDLATRLTAIAGPAGIRVVFDAVGGAAFAALTAAMAPGGILINYGGLSPEPTPYPLGQALGKQLTLRGYLVHHVTAAPERLEPAKRYILDGLAAGVLRPVIARRFPFEQIAEAHRFLESGEQFGKIVVTL